MNNKHSISLLLILCCTLSLSAQVITKGPYLADPKPGSMKIRWDPSTTNGSILVLMVPVNLNVIWGHRLEVM